MTNNCKIGPVTITAPHLTTEWQPEYKGNEKFRVKATEPQSLQLSGLVSDVKMNDESNRKKIAIMKGWGVIPVDGAEAIVNNDGLRPRGYYVLTDYLPAPRHGSPYVTGALELEKLSDNLKDYLEIAHTTGINDGTQLPSDYPETETTIFSDTFTTFDTSNVWYAPVYGGLGYYSMAASGGKLEMGVGASVSGTWGNIFSVNRTVFDAPFTIVAPLEWVALSANNHHEVGIYLYTSEPQSTAETGTIDHFRVLLQMSSTGAMYYVQSRLAQTWITHSSGNLATGEKTPNFKIRVDELGRINVWIDKAGGTTWTPLLANFTPGMAYPNGYYLCYASATNSTTTKTTRSAQIVITQEDTTSLNIVSAPVGNMVTTATFTRASADGNIPCYVNPPAPVPYNITNYSDFYKGCVSGWNANFTDTVARQITSNNMVLSSTKFYVDNGLIRLVTTATGVELYYWNGSSYTLLNTFVIGTINVLRVIECDPMRFTFQANRTFWTVEAGKQLVRLVHPETAITYTRSATGCYYHDGTTTDSPGANADITMATQNYTTIWSKGSGTCASPNPAQNYRLLIVKQNTDTIKSDSIPASIMTGIGWVNNTETAGSYKDAPSIAKEFMTKTQQRITLE